MEGEKPEEPVAAAVDMELEAVAGAGEAGKTNGVHDPQDHAAGKREREEEEGEEEAAKRTKTEKSVEEERLEEAEKEGDAVEKADGVPVKLGPKTFGSSVEMFDYFYKLLHAWSPDLEINKYEQLVLTELLRRGHPEPERKIAGGIRSFEVRYHPMWKSRCFFLVRADGSSDDFSFRKCVDHILPLPDSMKVPDGRKGGGAARGRGGRGRGRGRRGGR